MEYSYKGESLLQYLKNYRDTDKERMKLAQAIILFSLNHPEYSFEEAVEQYLTTKNQESKSSTVVDKGKKYRNCILPHYLQSNQLMFHGQQLSLYLKENCIHQFYDEKEVYACIRSIQHYLKKLNVSENEVEQGIEVYFQDQYKSFLQTYFINQMSYQGISFDTIIKYYIENIRPDDYDKDHIYYIKKKFVKFVKSHWDAETEKLSETIDLLLELFIKTEFNRIIQHDIQFMHGKNTITRKK